MSLRRTTALLLVSAAAYVASFLCEATGFLVCVFLVPFFEALRGARFSRGGRLGYGLGLLAIGAALHWLAANKGTPASQALAMWASTVVYLAFAWGAFGFIVALACRRFGERGLLAAPFAWTAMEFVQSQGALGFTWHSIANSLAGYTPIIQIAAHTGMFGLSFFAVSMNVLLYFAWRALTARGEAGWAARRIAIPVALAALATVVVLAHGALVLARAKAETSGGTVTKTAILQPAVDSNRKWRERNVAYMRLMRMTMALEGDDWDLLVWPETAVPFVLREHPVRLAAIEEALSEKGGVLLTGISDRRRTGPETAHGDLDDPDDRPDSRARRIKEAGWRKVNTVHLVRPGDTALETYEKLHLVPFGEYVPPFLGFLENMAMNVGSGIFVAGEEVHLFEIPARDARGERTTQKAAALICLESNFPSLVRRFVEEGADLLVVVANDEWYSGTPQAFQHAQIARLRAVEHHLPLIRCGNSGISAFVDPHGRVTASTTSEEEAVLVGVTSPGGTQTLYTRWGDWFPAGCLVVSLALLMLSLAGLRPRPLSD